MTDYYPQEEGAVFDAESYILPCRPDGAISEMSSVKVGTTAAGRISVIVSAALGDGIGIALRASTGVGTPDRIPIIFYGIVKATSSGTGYGAVAGSFAMNSVTTTCCGLSGAQDWLDLKIGGGASYVMGMWLQSEGAVGDECLMLVGKTA